LPSGQAIAREMRIPPLWYYVLKEAELNGGARLAGVGARIVGEVFLGLLKVNRNSDLSRNPEWRPTLPSRTPGMFQMVVLLTFAGVDPASRRQYERCALVNRSSASAGSAPRPSACASHA
jgi:hypothetical protein